MTIGLRSGRMEDGCNRLSIRGQSPEPSRCAAVAKQANAPALEAGSG